MADPLEEIYRLRGLPSPNDPLARIRAMRGEPTPEPTFESHAQETLGYDPTIDRGAILPLGRTEEGELTPAVPQMALDVAKSALLPGYVAGGGEYSPSDVTRMALDVSPAKPLGGARAGLSRYIKEAPTQKALREQADVMFDAAKAQGITVDPNSALDFVANVGQRLDREGFRSKKLTPKTLATLRQWEKEVMSGRPWDLQELELRRREAGAVAGSPDPTESKAGVIMKEMVDDYVDNLAPGDLSSGDTAGVSEFLKSYRQLWTRQAKVNEVTEMVERAERGASGLENSLRGEFRKLLNSKKRRRGFSMAELSAMEKIAKGDAIQNTLKFMSHFGPPSQGSNRFLGSAVGAGGGFTLGNLLAGPEAGAMAGAAGAAGLTGLGHLAGRKAASGARQNADMIQAMIARGQPNPRYQPKGEAIARQMVGPVIGTAIPPDEEKRRIAEFIAQGGI